MLFRFTKADFIKAAVSFGLLAAIAFKVDLGEVKERFMEASVWMATLGVACLALQMILGGLRWKVVTDAVGANLSLAYETRWFTVASFVNQALPSTIGGDAARAYKAHRDGMELSAAVNSVFLERASGTLALLLVMIVMQPSFSVRAGAENGVILLAITLISTSAGVVGLILFVWMKKLPLDLDRFKWVALIRAAATDTRKIFLSPTALSRLLFWGGATYVNLCFSVYLLALSLGLSVTFLDCMALVPPVALAAALPISLSGWGVREGMMVALFVHIGVPGDSALALSVALGLASILVSLPGAISLSNDCSRTAAEDPRNVAI